MREENKNTGVSDEQLTLTRQDAVFHNMNQRAEQDDNRLDTELLSSMIDNKHLFFKHEVNAGILSIQLRMTKLSSAEQKKREEAEFKKYTRAVLDKLDAFKKEEKLPEDPFKLTHDQDNNTRVLTVAFSSPHFYKIFIQRLMNSNLLPLQMTHPNFHNSSDVTKEVFRNNYFYPRRLARTLKTGVEINMDEQNPGADDRGKVSLSAHSSEIPEPPVSSIPSPYRTPRLVPIGSTQD